MKKIAILFMMVLSFAACEDLTSLNEAPKQATNALPQGLFANAQKALATNMASTNVNSNIFRLFAQYWTQTTYTDESRYDMSTRNIPQNFWNAQYRDVLMDLRESRKIVAAINPLFIDPAVRANQLAMIDITEIYTNSVLVTAFGNIPYSEALNSEDLQPSYDDAETVFTNLISRLNATIASMDNSAGAGDFETSDLLYHGDIDAWILFANSLKLKLGMTIADSNPASAETTVEAAAAAGVFTSNADNARFVFLSAPPNTNPVWVDLVQSGRKDYVAANTIVDRMKALSDPRVPIYFTVNNVGGYSGGTYGVSNSFATFSKPGAVLKTQTSPHLLLDYAEVEFYLAEAVARGWTVGTASAAEHYTNAITGSMKYWGVTGADIATYLARPDVDYVTATGTYKEKIGMQKWLALYNRGYEAWTEWRRLDAPTLITPPGAFSVLPLRLTYPVQEQNLNGTNYAAAAAAVGGDNVATKLFWDKN